MIRLRKEDFEDPHDVAKLAATAHLGLEAFRDQFAYLTENEPSGPVSTASGAVRA
jgi:6-phosphofructokinase 1